MTSLEGTISLRTPPCIPFRLQPVSFLFASALAPDAFHISFPSVRKCASIHPTAPAVFTPKPHGIKRTPELFIEIKGPESPMGFTPILWGSGGNNGDSGVLYLLELVLSKE